MADYRAIASTETDPLAPVTSALVKALAANPIAISEGATGAPRIANAAFDDGTISSSKFQGGSTETNWVLARNQSAGAGGAGTYAFLRNSTGGGFSKVPGDLVAGSKLRYSAADGYTGSVASGTWRCMGTSTDATDVSRTTLWLRVA